MTSYGERSVPLSAIRSGEKCDSEIEECARCGSRFPAPGVERQDRVYCCEKCAMGPSLRVKAVMLPLLASLVGAGALIGWMAARVNGKK
jgi:hypothetical protein